MLPFFGKLSDRTHTRIGKRMPYILFGTGLAVIFTNILPVLDNSYAMTPSSWKMFLHSGQIISFDIRNAANWILSF